MRFTKKEKEYKESIINLVTKWKDLLGLYNWVIDIMWDDDVDAGTHLHSLGWQALFEMVASWPYMLASLHVNCKYLCELDDERLEELIIHELMHLILAELREAKSNDLHLHEERVVTMLSRAFNRLNKENMEKENIEILTAPLPETIDSNSPKILETINNIYGDGSHFIDGSGSFTECNVFSNN